MPNPYGFSTKEFSSAIGLVYFGFRYYNPTTGRWLKPDPLGMINGPNLYAYVNNNPVNMIDPWGLETGNGGNFPGGNYTPDDGTGEQNPSGGSDSPKTNECSGGQPTNPDMPWWGSLADLMNDHINWHRGLINQCANMNPDFTPWAGWGGATLIVAGAETMQLSSDIIAGGWTLGPGAGIIGTLIGGGMFIAGGETAMIGIDIILGAILAQRKNK